MRKSQVGTVPDGRIAIRDGNGNLVGHVGPHAIAGTVQRFNVRNPKLVNVHGRLEWHGDNVPGTRRRSESKNHAAARGSVRAPRGTK